MFVTGQPLSLVYPDPDQGLFRLLVENAADVLLLTDSAFRWLYVSPGCHEVMGYQQTELLGRIPSGLLHPDDADRVMAVLASLGPQNPIASAGCRMLCANGTFRWMETTCRRLNDGMIVCAVRDIQRRKQTEEQLERALARVERLAMHDPLTNLPNRRSFLDAVDGCLSDVTAGHEVAVLVIDLDRFKPVNDVHGHAVGDIVLVEIASRLQGAVGTHAVIARLGGDEFAALLCGESAARVEQIAHAIVEAVCVPLTVGRIVVELGASVGIAMSPADGLETESLLRRADAAMYHAKHTGRARYHFFDPEMDSAVMHRADLQMELRHAISCGEIVPYYHPLIDLRNGTIIGLEALARWTHPDRGILEPKAFIGLVEQMGHCDALFAAILERACNDALTWPSHIRISVNLSPMQLSDATLPRRVAQILSSADLDPSRLVLEVTESQPVSDSRSARVVLADIRALGVAIALDDFGTGHSSLSLLQEINFDQLKIDRSFVRRDIDDPRNARYLKAIIGLGQALDLEITAEGIETEATMQALLELGCAVGQGNIYGTPVSAAEVGPLLARYNGWQIRSSDGDGSRRRNHGRNHALAETGMGLLMSSVPDEVH